MHTTQRKLFIYLARSLILLIVLLGLIVVTLEYMSLSFTLDGARRALVENLESQTGRGPASLFKFDPVEFVTRYPVSR